MTNEVSELKKYIAVLESQVKDSIIIEKALVKARNSLRAQLKKSQLISEFMASSSLSGDFTDIYKNFFCLLTKVASLQAAALFRYDKKSGCLLPLSLSDADGTVIFPSHEFRIKVSYPTGMAALDIHREFASAQTAHSSLKEIFHFCQFHEIVSSRESLESGPLLSFSFESENPEEMLVCFAIGMPPKRLSEFDPQLSEEDKEFFHLLRSAFQKIYMHKSTYNDLHKLAYCLEGEVVKSNDVLKTTVSELKKTQLNLVHNEKMAALGIMAAGIAHEINNPLMVIVGHNAYLRRVLSRGDVTEDKLNMLKSVDLLENTVFRISRIIKGLQSFARNDDEGPLREEFIIPIIQECVDLCMPRFRSAGIELHFVPCPHDIFVSIRKTQLQQVIVNLLNNSFDAIEKKEAPWVKIHIENEKDHLRLLVSDSGSGIPKSDLKKIFNPFFTTKEVGKGTGLGLSISKGLMENQGGELLYNESSPFTQFVIKVSKVL